MAREALRAAGGEGAGLMLEREREMEAIERALDRLGGGVGALLVVEGPAGIGKTRLLSAASETARARELQQRAARGGHLEREVPFGVARQLFEAVVERASEEERSRLLAGSAGLAQAALGRAGPEGGAGDPFAPIHGLYWLVANLAEERPMVLVIDDAHWLDAQTLRFLVYLARRLDDIPVLVIASVRSGEPGQPRDLEPLRAEGEVLRPAPLSLAAVEALIAAELDAKPDPEFTAVCADATAGNPFLLAEVVRTLRADRAEPTAAAAESIAQLGPESVARYMLIRLGRFRPDAIALARAIAVLGGAPQLRHAAALAEIREDRAAELCDRLREAEILSPGLPIEFVHPLVRQAIYREQPEAECSSAHRRAAQILDATDASARELAPHLLACAPNGDQWVVAKLREAATEASGAGAPASAKLYLERALAEPPVPELEMPVLAEHGVAHRAAEPVSVPETLVRVAEGAADRKLRIRAMRHLSFACYSSGDLEGSMRWNRRLLDETAATDQDRRCRVEAQLSIVATSAVGRTPSRSQHLASLVADADPSTRGGGLIRQALSWDRFLGCEPVEGVVDLARSFPGVFGRDIASPMACFVLAWSGRWDEARLATTMAVEGSRRAGLMPEFVTSSALLAEIDRLAGRLAEAEAEARTVAGMLADLGGDSLPRAVAVIALLEALITRGELADAAAFADRHLEASELAELPPLPTPTATRGHLRLAQGQLEEGVECMLTVGNRAEEFGFLNPASPHWRQEAAPALAALGRTAEARELIAVAEERARRFGAAHVIGTVLRARGLIEPKRRQLEILRQSVAALEEYGPPHELARSLLELGAALRRDGQRSDSREPLRRALELAHRSGAGGIEARAREELAASGSRPRSVFRTGVAALTASELRTAKLAAEGLSNVEIAQRLFVTRKTVEKHLGNAYSKLEIGGREELAAALAAAGAAE